MEAQHLLGTREAYLCHFVKGSPCHQVPQAPLWGLVTLPNVPGDIDAQSNQSPGRMSCSQNCSPGFLTGDFNACFFVDLYHLQGQSPVRVDLKDNLLFLKRVTFSLPGIDLSAY